MNVKLVVFETGIEDGVVLDTTLTPELKEEGFVRDLIRAIQAARRASGLTISDASATTLSASDAARAIMEKFRDEIAEATKSQSVTISQGEEGEPIGDFRVSVAVKKA